ncbi:putative exported protein [Halobacteriovorax marinus SJ]|uniref:Exported protein n=1 Tax=Halobacteriovorax marinus (strain ATCC BAA-682 / DSM 15412 / SJ) TaxID=862908 RepID=E1X699_HALMS|nr:autotransporter domain-containing protein [Halobacteriovorax marinus]CBW27444.1 putative exported protein [Halobacteriovorax marinus SJ]
MRFKISVISLIFLLSLNSHALIELGMDFSYDKDVFGTNRDSKNTSRTWSGSIATYLWEYTALELNYMENSDKTVINESVTYTDLDITVLGQQTNIETKSYGVGLRQSFASRKSLIQPSISLGYARTFKESQTNYTIRSDISGNSFTSVSPMKKERQDSMFGTFSLKFRLTKRLSLRGSVQTYIRAFEWNSAKDDLRYTAGFTWLL